MHSKDAKGAKGGKGGRKERMGFLTANERQ